MMRCARGGALLDAVYWGVAIVAVLAVVFYQPYFEAKAYSELTGKHVTYWQAEVGDYILTDPSTGDTWPVKRDLFLRTYEVVE